MANNTQFLYHMGRFYFFERSSNEMINDNRRILRIDDEPLHPLQAIDLVDCDVYESFTLPTNVFECITHAIKRLTVDHLKIMTLACAAMNFMIYIFWWNKPLNINQSVRMFWKSEPPLEMQPWAGELISEATWEVIGKGLGTILMLIGKRMSTWVAMSVAITALPLLILFRWQTWTSILLYSFFHPLLGGILYILPWAMTLVLAFTSLRNLPPRIYEMCRSWNSFTVSTIIFWGGFSGRSQTSNSAGIILRSGSILSYKWWSWSHVEQPVLPPFSLMINQSFAPSRHVIQVSCPWVSWWTHVTNPPCVSRCHPHALRKSCNITFGPLCIWDPGLQYVYFVLWNAIISSHRWLFKDSPVRIIIGTERNPNQINGGRSPPSFERSSTLPQ